MFPVLARMCIGQSLRQAAYRCQNKFVGAGCRGENMHIVHIAAAGFLLLLFL